MAEAIVEQQEDTEISDAAEQLTETFEAVFDLLVQRRDSQYAAEIAPLDVEQAQLRQEHGSIGMAAHNLELLLPAKARIAQSEADQLTVAGNSEEAKTKLAEMLQAERAPEAMRARQREIFNRIEAIEVEKQNAARRIFETHFAEVQTAIRAAERGLFVALLDGLKQSFFDFEQRTGTYAKGVGQSGLFNRWHLSDLTAPERSEEWQAGTRWYGGRGRR